MRIGLIIYDSLEPRSGGYLYDARLVETLTSHGIEVDILSQPWQSLGMRLLQNENRGFLERILASNYDLIVQDELNHPSLYEMNYKIKGRSRVPIISVVHHLRISEDVSPVFLPIQRQVEKRYLKSIDHFVFNSHTTNREVSTLLGYPVEGLVAYPGKDLLNTGMEEKEIQERCHRLHPIRLVFAGNLIPRKGLDLALNALALVKDLKWTFDIVGDQKADARYTRKLRGMVMSLGLNDRVSFHGRMEPPRLSDMFKQSQILLSPAQYEGFGITFVEAMGCGLPVIALATGAAPEVVADGESGLLVKPADVEGLAAAIRTLAGDIRTLEKISLGSRARYDRFPTWDQSMNSIYDQMVKWIENAG